MKSTQDLITQTLEFIAQNNNEEQGSKFLKNTAKHLSKLFNIKYVFINKYSLKKPTIVETVVFFGKEEFLPNKAYKLVNTPCENVVNSKACVYPNNLQALFSKDKALERLNAQSYIGVPLWSSSGEPIGLITIIHDKPILDTKPIEINLQIIALKIAQVFEKEIFKNSIDSKSKDFEVLSDLNKENEEKFSKAFYNHPVAMQIVDFISGKRKEVNESYLELFEFSKEEYFKGKIFNNSQILNPEILKNNKKKLVEFGSFKNSNFKFLSKQGKVKHSLVNGTELNLNKENLAILSFIDITNQKNSEERYKSLSEASFEAVFLTENGIAIEQNASAQKMFGYTDDEIVGRKSIELIVGKDHELALKNIKSENEITYEVTAVRKDGTTFPAAIKARMTNYKGKKVRITAFKELTVQKKLEAETTKLTTAVEQSANTIVITDIKGTIEYVNPKFTEITGYTAEEAIGQNPRVLKSGNQTKEYYKKMWKTISAGESWNGEFQNKSKNGTIFWEQVTITPIKNELGTITNYLAVKEDITKRKKAEENLNVTFDLLKENEEYLSRILKTTNEGFWAIGINNKTLEVNPEMCKILGFKESDIIGKPIFNFVDRENAKIFKEEVKKRKLGVTSKYEIELKNSKGINIPCLFKTSPIYNNNKERVGSFAMVTDISAIKEAYYNSEKHNEELKKLSLELSEKNHLLIENTIRFKNLFELSPVSIWEQDYSGAQKLLIKKKKQVKDLKVYLDNNPNFVIACIHKIKIVKVNNITLNLIGVKNKEELLSQLRNTLNTDAIEVLKKELLVIASDDINELKEEVKFIKTDGTEITTILRLMKVNNNGKVIITLNDITALKKAEIKVKESELKFRELYEKSGDAILIIKNGIFVECNNSAITLLDYTSKDEFLNVHPSKLSPKKQLNGLASSKEAERMMNLALKNGTHRFEWVHLKSNGDEFPVEVLLTAISNEPSNKIIHCVWRDISERKKAEKELILTKEAAEESDRLKTEFLNNMSHEIRTPMNGILGFSQMLKEQDLDQNKRNNFINIIQSSGHQLLHIIDDILEISRLGTKQVKVLEEEVCLNEVLLELFSIFDIKAKENIIPLYLKKSVSDQQSIFISDKTKLVKIISNLLENALKFTNNGFIEFGYNIINSSQDDSQLEIYVKDTGIGIKPEKHNLIFERFEQAEKELTRKVGGLGLGLSIAKENTELLGGKISVISEMMKGATFFVTIPFNQVNKVIENKEVNKYTILIAEDEEVNYMYIETILKDVMKLDVNILHAKNGREAIETCKNNSTIDIILMDIKMPFLNGLIATKQIRKFRPNLPIIAQTAYSTIEDKEEALAVGCNDFISKPIEKETLTNIIDKFLIKDIY